MDTKGKMGFWLLSFPVCFGIITAYLIIKLSGGWDVFELTHLRVLYALFGLCVGTLWGMLVSR